MTHSSAAADADDKDEELEVACDDNEDVAIVVAAVTELDSVWDINELVVDDDVLLL